MTARHSPLFTLESGQSGLGFYTSQWDAALARIALAGRGIQIQPDPPPPPSPGERRKLVRDALRMSLWRATGSTGGWLVPQAVARKRLQCGL